MKTALSCGLVAAALTSSAHSLNLIKRDGVEPRVVGIPIHRRTDNKIVASSTLRRRAKDVEVTLDNFEVSSIESLVQEKALLIILSGWLALLCQRHYGHARTKLSLSYRYW